MNKIKRFRGVEVKRLGRIILYCMLTIVFCGNAFSCSKPVFRYALEKWAVDPYIVSIVYNDRLSDNEVNIFNYYKKFSNSKECIVCYKYDASGEKLPREISSIVDEYEPASLPLVIVNYPPDYKIEQPAGVYPLTMEAAKLLMESLPAREVARRIMKGDAVVFLQLDCDNEQLNSETAKKIKQQLRGLEENSNELNSGDSSMLVSGASPQEIKFSLMRISRKESRNIPFVKMLLNASKEFEDAEGPVVFPIFGRGRVLCGIYGKDLNRDTIDSIVTFINGSCSCEIKYQNPGFDVLLPVDWLEFINDEEAVANSLPSTSLMTKVEVKGADKSANNPNTKTSKVLITFFMFAMVVLCPYFFIKLNKGKDNG